MVIDKDDVEDLLRNLPADDPQVFEAMVRTYRGSLYRLALSMLNDADEAEDAVQDTLVNATRALSRYQVGSNFKAWIYTTAINTCRDYLRKRTVRRSFTQIWGVVHILVPYSPGPEASTIENESRTRLWDLVDELGMKHRLVVILRLGQDLSIQEISQILGIREKTVYSRLYDAYKQLRLKIKFSTKHANYWSEHLQ